MPLLMGITAIARSPLPLSAIATMAASTFFSTTIIDFQRFHLLNLLRGQNGANLPINLVAERLLLLSHGRLDFSTSGTAIPQRLLLSPKALLLRLIALPDGGDLCNLLLS